MDPIYLDCNATTPLEGRVRDVLFRYASEEYGNAGSRTHEYGVRAKQAVQRAREQVAATVSANIDEVVFTSGATESNNLAILGLKEHGQVIDKMHVITTAIEHKAVLEPFDELERLGFEVTRLPVGVAGYVTTESLSRALRPDTLMVSVMQINNETGIRQPLTEICEALGGHSAYFHTDAAQGFGKDLLALRNKRIDLISISGHKIFAPKGVGALVVRRRGYDRVPLRPLVFGGGQERGLRPGTLPVQLIVALGLAAEIAVQDNVLRQATCARIRAEAIAAFAELMPRYSGDQSMAAPHVLNVAFQGLDSEALIVATKDMIAISNGSACTSSNYLPSHVLTAMGMTNGEANACVRISWSHLTPNVDWGRVAERIRSLI